MKNSDTFFVVSDIFLLFGVAIIIFIIILAFIFWWEVLYLTADNLKTMLNTCLNSTPSFTRNIKCLPGFFVRFSRVPFELFTFRTLASSFLRLNCQNLSEEYEELVSN
jgi:hypothetical protein